MPEMVIHREECAGQPRLAWASVPLMEWSTRERTVIGLAIETFHAFGPRRTQFSVQFTDTPLTVLVEVEAMVGPIWESHHDEQQWSVERFAIRASEVPAQLGGRQREIVRMNGVPARDFDTIMRALAATIREAYSYEAACDAVIAIHAVQGQSDGV